MNTFKIETGPAPKTVKPVTGTGREDTVSGNLKKVMTMFWNLNNGNLSRFRYSYVWSGRIAVRYSSTVARL